MGLHVEGWTVWCQYTTLSEGSVEEGLCGFIAFFHEKGIDFLRLLCS